MTQSRPVSVRERHIDKVPHALPTTARALTTASVSAASLSPRGRPTEHASPFPFDTSSSAAFASLLNLSGASILPDDNERFLSSLPRRKVASISAPDTENAEADSSGAAIAKARHPSLSPGIDELHKRYRGKDGPEGQKQVQQQESSQTQAVLPGMHFPLRTVYFPATSCFGGAGAFLVSTVRIQLCNTSGLPLMARVVLEPAPGGIGISTGAPNDVVDPSGSGNAADDKSGFFKAFSVKRAHQRITLRPRSFVMLPVQFSPASVHDLRRLCGGAASSAAGGNFSLTNVLCGAVLSVHAEVDSHPVVSAAIAKAHGDVGGQASLAAAANGPLKLLCKALLVGEAVVVPTTGVATPFKQ